MVKKVSVLGFCLLPKFIGVAKSKKVRVLGFCLLPKFIGVANSKSLSSSSRWAIARPLWFG
jgi:hypothetical protein